MTIHQAKGLEFPVVVVPDVAATGGGPHYPVVTWNARLGSVVRPPADEDPPPFAPFAWDLWKAAESIEEWHEDLRTLYVACTRAQDYLVLSAALQADYRPANAWMSTLAERFDLRTGACRVPGIPTEKIPPVRVTDSRTPPPEPGMPLPEKRSPEGAEPEVSHLAVTAVPVRLTGREILTVGQIEHFVRQGEGVLQPADLAWQFDAEDGSDRTAWALPHQRLVGSRDPDAGLRDRLLRLVLERWDFQDAGAWREILRQAAAADMATELEPLVAGFAASPTFRLLAEARVCFRDVEFLTTLEGAAAGPLKIRGIIDFLCQDERGDWQVIAWTAERVSPAERDHDWRCREPGLALAARAIQQTHGAWPTTITFAYLTEGVTITPPVQQFQRPEILTNLHAQLANAVGLLR
jgi:hypothetical protein